MGMAAIECISVDRTFLRRTMPPENRARPGVIRRTSAVLTRTHAVSPLSSFMDVGVTRPAFLTRFEAVSLAAKRRRGWIETALSVAFGNAGPSVVYDPSARAY